jgi:hypothetical protein
MMHRVPILAFIAFAVMAAAAFTPVAAQNTTSRVALVIGNGSYSATEKPLSQVVPAAHALADELRRTFFNVELHENLTREGMHRALDRFYALIERGSTALIFFSGYGIETKRQNYLMPVDARIETEEDVRLYGISLDTVLAEMKAKGASTKIAIIDAARSNPFESHFRPEARGLAPVVVPNETLVIFSSGPGKIAADSDTNNEQFFRQLINEMRVPNLSMEDVFNRVRIGVTRQTAGTQVPWVASSLVNDFYLVPSTASRAPPSAPAPERSPPVQSAPTRPNAEAAARVDAQRKPGEGRPVGTEVEPRAETPAPPAPAPPSAAAIAPPSASTPPAARELAESLGDKLRTLPAKYNRPNTLSLGASSQVELVIQTSGQQPIDDMLKGLPGEIRSTVVRMGTNASAYLTGPKDLVDISLRGEPLRTVTADAPVSWIWDVRPLKPGQIQVVLEVFSHVRIGGDEGRAQFRVLQDTWNVEAKGFEWVKYQVAEIQPIWALLSAAVTGAAGLLAFFGIKGRKTVKPRAEET